MEIEFVDPKVEALEKRMEYLIDLVEMVIERTDGNLTADINYIARKEGCHPAQLRKGGRERYLLPRFGESGYPVGTCRWDVREYAKWRAIPRKERYSAYQKQLDEERRKAVLEARKASRIGDGA